MDIRALKSAASVVAALTFGVPVATAQEQPTGGTLTLVLANRNGFVIASDSRRSNPFSRFPCGGSLAFYCDDSQKVFKTGPSSAMAISGFASWVGGTPLDLHVASVLRRRYRYLYNPKAKPPVWKPPKGARPAMTEGFVAITAYKSRDPHRTPVD